MNVIECMEKRHSTRQFSTRKVEKEKLEQIRTEALAALAGAKDAQELDGLGIGTWTEPKGGYFISFDSLDGCAKDIVARCKKAGVVMTPAGATYPYGKDPHDSNIRIAPTYPPLSDLITATELFALCVKLVSVEKLLKAME